MKRSAGVTAAAVISLIGSVFAAMLGALGYIGMVIASRRGIPGNAMPQQGPLPLIASMGLGVFVEIGFAAWGLSTAVGLLGLKAWSRVSILIYAGLLALTSVFFILIFAIVPLPPTPGTPDNFNFILRMAMELFGVAMLSIATWWLVFFTRKSVVTEFSMATEWAPGVAYSANLTSPVDVVAKLRRPLSITIIAWLFLASTPMSILSLLVSGTHKTPMPFFWTILEGTGTKLYMAFLIPLTLAAGIAILRNKAWSLWLAFGIQAFGLLNFAMVALLPGREERWERYTKLMRNSYPPQLLAQSPDFPATMMILILVAGSLTGLIFMLLLWSRRKRFFAFAAQQANTGSTGS